MSQGNENPSANQGQSLQGSGLNQPREPRIPPRVDTMGNPTPGHRLDRPRPTEESMEQGNAPKGSSLAWTIAKYSIPAGITVGGISLTWLLG